MGEDHKEHQRAYHERQLDKGLVRLSVYVPRAEREEFWEAIERLRKRWKKKGIEL